MADCARPTTPDRPNSTRLDRDNRIRILTLRDAGFTYQQIVDHLPGITYRQVQYTCQPKTYSPKKARGQTPKLSASQVDDILAFISSSERAKRLPYVKIIQELDLKVSTRALARALRTRGYSRGVKKS